MKKHYPSFDIKPQHLGNVVRCDNQKMKRKFSKRYKNPIKEKIKKIQVTIENNVFILYEKLTHSKK
jgi:hypothetical protein